MSDEVTEGAPLGRRQCGHTHETALGRVDAGRERRHEAVRPETWTGAAPVVNRDRSDLGQTHSRLEDRHVDVSTRDRVSDGVRRKRRERGRERRGSRQDLQRSSAR